MGSNMSSSSSYSPPSPIDEQIQDLVSNFTSTKKRIEFVNDFRLYESTKEALLEVAKAGVVYPTATSTRTECSEWWKKMGPVFASVMAGWSGEPPNDEFTTKVSKTDLTIEENVSIRILKSNNNKDDDNIPTPTLVYFHGGGFAVWSCKDTAYDNYLTRLAALGTCTVVAVDYISAVDAPYPAGLEQCISACRYAIEGKLPGVHAGKICLAGDSSGGNLAVACALKAKEQSWLSDITGIYTICPYFDGKTKDVKYPSMIEFDGYFASEGFLNAVVNGVLEEKKEEWSTNPLLWPIYASTEQLSGLPPTKTVVMELDMIRDMGLAFHYKLQQAKVDASMMIVSGGVHEQQLFTLHSPEVTESSIHDLSAFVCYVSKRKEEE